MKILFFAVFLIMTVLVFAGLCLIVRTQRFEEEKYLHFRYFCGVFLAEIIVLNYFVSTRLLRIIDTIIKLPLVSNLINIVFPNRAYELNYMLLVVVGLNIVVVLTAIIVMAVLRLFFGTRQMYFLDPEEYYGIRLLMYIPHKIVTKFYDYHDGAPVLSERGYIYALWARNMKWLFALLGIAEILTLGISAFWGSEAWNDLLRSLSKAWYWVPMVGYILTEQIQFFLEDPDQEEESGSFGSSNIEDSMYGENIGRLVELYRSNFQSANALLYDSQINGVDQGMSYNSIGNIRKEDCTKSDVLDFLLQQVKVCNIKQPIAYQSALVTLLNGKSLNVCEHPEGEFLFFLVAYLNYILSQGETVLILCRDDEQTAMMQKALKSRMEQLNQIGGDWRIVGTGEASADSLMNILVCTYDELLNKKVLEKRKDFARDLTCMVFLSGLYLFSRDTILTDRVFNYLESNSGKRKKQYVLLTDEDNSNVRTAMRIKAKLKDDDIYTINNHVSLRNAYVMVWKEESICKLQCCLGLGNDLSAHMGTALPLALMAVKNDIKQVNVVSSRERGDHTYRSVMGTFSSDIMRYVGGMIDLETSIRSDTGEVFRKKDLAVMTVYDSDCNLCKTIQTWEKYGGRHGTILHVISPSYLLREYMAAKASEEDSIQTRTELDALVSYEDVMEKSKLQELLIILHDQGMYESALMQKCREYKLGYRDMESLLNACLRLVYSSRETQNVYEAFHFEEHKYFSDHANAFVTDTFVRLHNDETYKRILEMETYAELNDGAETQQLPVLRDDISNYYLPGQIIAFNGTLYEIRSIHNGMLTVHQASVIHVPQYFPIASFSIRNRKVIDACVDNGLIDFNVCSAEVTRKVYGYWSCTNGNKFADRKAVGFNVPDADDGFEELSDTKQVNILELRLRKSEIGEKAEECAATLTYILNELFKTFFPDTWQNLFAVCTRPNNSEFLQGIVNNGYRNTTEDIIRSIIPAVETETDEADDDVVVQVIEFSGLEYGMVQLLYANRKNIIHVIHEYLKWYLEDPVTATTADKEFISSEESEVSKSGEILTEEAGAASPEQIEETDDIGSAQTAGDTDKQRGEYLHFGCSEVPSVFALHELTDFLAKLIVVRGVPDEIANETIRGTQYCSYCRRPVVFSNQTDDGRLICNYCYDHRLSQYDEIKVMYRDTVSMLQRWYLIEVPKNIHIRFKSAAEIRKAAGGDMDCRVLGFMNPRNNQLWVEARGPVVPMQGTLIHELTHAWQFAHLPVKKLRAKLPRKNREELYLMLMEGHAVYVEVETMRRMSEQDYAKRLHDAMIAADDPYGVGYRLIRKYFDQYKGEGSHMTPFSMMELLIDNILKGEVSIS